MIEVAHRRQLNSPNFRSKSSKSASASRFTNSSDSSPLPIRRLQVPPSPLIKQHTTRTEADIIRSVKEASLSDSQQSRSIGSTTGTPSSSISTRSILKQKTSPRAASSAMSSTLKAGISLPMTASESAPSSPKNLAVHRIRRGQKIEDFQPPALSQLPSLTTIDSAFQLQEYLSALLRQGVHDVDRVVAVPQPSTESLDEIFESEKGKSRESENPFGSMEEEETTSVDTDVWIYEQLRRIVLDFSTPWLTMLQRECDKTKKSCEAMNADDWMYLCASHGEEKQCCAIDYMIHTLDGTTALLNSQRHFPSRTYIPTTSLRHFGSASRRISRIFVHTYEHHRDVFEICEGETALYARFLALVQTYDLIHVDSLPRLGKTMTNLEGGVVKEKVSKDSQVTEGEIITAESIRGGEKGLLFEAEIGASNDDEEENEEEEDEEDELEKVEEESREARMIEERSNLPQDTINISVPSSTESRAHRSDSVASRLTAIDTSDVMDSDEVKPTSTDGVTKAKVEIAREIIDEERASQDVKKDEDKEVKL